MIVQRRKARSTRTVVEVLDNRSKSFFDDNERWYTICVDHGGLASHPTRSLAVRWASMPEHWCDECQKKSS